MTSHQQSVQEQFNSKAESYLTSEVHKQGPDLQHAIAKIISENDHIHTAVDLGCGAGHLSFALADSIEYITAVDLSQAMIDVVSSQVEQRGLTNINVINSSVETLPFEDNSIDLVCSRYSAHHWTDMSQAMQEIKRIIKPNGIIMMIDIEGFSDPVIDTHFQTIEILRDRSHVRNRTNKEWHEQFTSIGFKIKSYESFQVRIDFQSWVERMQTSQDKIEIIKKIQYEASVQVRDALKIEADASFTAMTGVWWAKA